MRYQINKSFRSKCFLAIVAVGSMLAVSSCNKKLDIESSSIVSQNNAWKTLEDARSGVMGMYALLRTAVANNNAYWHWGEFRSGLFTPLNSPDLSAVVNNELTANYSVIESASNWTKFYAAINACNVVIENIGKCRTDMRYTDDYYRLDVSQAKAVRAFAYFLMARVWGDVPLITTSGEGKDFPEVAQSQKEVVLNFAKTELLSVAEDLPYLYSGTDLENKFPATYYGFGAGTWLNAPITRIGAYAILSHIAAWEGNYDEAIVYSGVVVNNVGKGNITAVETEDMVSSSGLFLSGNSNYRQIVGFPFGKMTGETTIDGHIENYTLANTPDFPMSKRLPNLYIPRDTILKMFNEPTDERFGTNFNVQPVVFRKSYFENFNGEIPVFKKIRVIDAGSTSTNGDFVVYNSSIIFTRLEEIRLLRAEAFAALNNLTDAAQLLNLVRASRNLGGIDYTSREQLLRSIFLERDRELMGEGWHWFDLVRRTKLLNDNPQIASFINSGAIYWPISKSVLLKNKKLVQNNYWK
ncbi:MAG: RagB/SusD family nutrient uptake outer membrane protein [Chitinophagaceae bacterium]|nr:MAG: RagB/SusD family nutrient uptake outer membrane protein [Chitinophagaceae bacterium]